MARTSTAGARTHPASPGARPLRLGLVAVALLLAAAAACDDDGITVPGDEAAQVGVIVEVDATPFAAAVPGRTGALRTEVARNIWVKEDTAQACGVVWTLGSTTDVLVRTGSALRRAVDADLAVGRSVRVWTDGPVAESCPAQGLATAVELR